MKLTHFGSRLALMTASFCIVLVGAVAAAAITSGTRTTASSTQVTYTEVAVAKPSVAVGDVMLATIAVNGGSSATITAPSGWTQIARTDNDTNVALISYWKVVGGSEPSSYTWHVTGQTTAQGSIIPYSGVDTSNPIDTYASNIGFSTAASTSVITTSAANEQIVALFAADVGKNSSANAYFNTPLGMTEKFDDTNMPYGPTIAGDEVLQTSAGTFGSVSSTISGNKERNWATQTIALRPSSTDIAFDNAAYGPISSITSVGPSITITRGTSGINYIGIVSVLGDCAISGVTWGGVAMAEFMDVAAQGGHDRLYYVINPGVGTQTVTAGVTGSCGMQALTYSGVSQTSPLDTNFDGSSNGFVASFNSSVAPGSDVTATGTTHIDRSYAVSVVDMNATVSAGSNAVERIPNGAFDGGTVTTPAGSVSMGIHNNSGFTQEIDVYMFALQPAN